MSGFRAVLSEFVDFVLQRPAVPTLIRFRTSGARDQYHARILQRIGTSVDRYSILNIHRIGVDAPLTLVWRQVLGWGPASPYWPGAIAWIERLGGGLECFLLGRTEPLPVLGKGLLGMEFIPLFRMDLERLQDTPDAMDNARYLLYRCVGGYPIGLFSIYVRTAIPSEGERERTQVFFVVAFDFYGRPHWSTRGPVRWLWERVHNRVTSNVLNRFKVICEAEFAEVQAGA